MKRELETAEEEEARIEEIEDLQKLAEESVVARQELETETQRLTGQTNQSLNGIAERDEMIRQLEAVAKRLGKNLERAGGVIADLVCMWHVTWAVGNGQVLCVLCACVRVLNTKLYI